MQHARQRRVGAHVAMQQGDGGRFPPWRDAATEGSAKRRHQRPPARAGRQLRTIGEHQLQCQQQRQGRDRGSLAPPAALAGAAPGVRHAGEAGRGPGARRPGGRRGGDGLRLRWNGGVRGGRWCIGRHWRGDRGRSGLRRGHGLRCNGGPRCRCRFRSRCGRDCHLRCNGWGRRRFRCRLRYRCRCRRSVGLRCRCGLRWGFRCGCGFRSLFGFRCNCGLRRGCRRGFRAGRWRCRGVARGWCERFLRQAGRRIRGGGRRGGLQGLFATRAALRRDSADGIQRNQELAMRAEHEHAASLRTGAVASIRRRRWQQGPAQAWSGCSRRMPSIRIQSPSCTASRASNQAP